MWFREPPQYNKIEAKQLNWLAALGQYTSVFILSWYLKLFFRSYKVLNPERVPKEPLNYVVASNHISSLDPPIISVALRYRLIAYMAKQELYKKRIIGEYYYSMGTFAVNREKLEMATIRSALTVLKQPGWLLGIFPQGTRNEDGQVGEAKKGVSFIAKTAKVGVLPVAIARKGEDRKDIRIQIGEFIPYDENRSLEDLTILVQTRMAEILTQVESD